MNPMTLRNLASLALLLCCAVCHAQGGNCEPPTPEELARMQQARRSAVVAPAPAASVSKFRGTNRRPVPTRREAELLNEIKRLEREIGDLKRLLRGEPQEDPVPWVESGASRERPADNRLWTAQDWADYVDEYAVYGAGG